MNNTLDIERERRQICKTLKLEKSDSEIPFQFAANYLFIFGRLFWNSLAAAAATALLWMETVVKNLHYLLKSRRLDCAIDCFLWVWTTCWPTIKSVLVLIILGNKVYRNYAQLCKGTKYDWCSTRPLFALSNLQKFLQTSPLLHRRRRNVPF